MLGERFRDTLAAGGPYDGVVASAYDAWLPPGVVLPDDAVHTSVIRRCGGVALELGAGNGRFLIPLLEEGLVVEGVDSSADMLERCRLHAERRGLEVVLHHGDMAPLRIPRTYAAICCTAGSFTLIGDADRARKAVRSYFEHLDAGGTVSITMYVPGNEADTGFQWRLRRTGSDPDGTTYVVHEATGVDRSEQIELVYNRIEVVNAQGRVTETVLRKHRLRWWTEAELGDLLSGAGFTDVSAVGSNEGWVTIGRRP